MFEEDPLAMACAPFMAVNTLLSIATFAELNSCAPSPLHFLRLFCPIPRLAHEVQGGTQVSQEGASLL